MRVSQLGPLMHVRGELREPPHRVHRGRPVLDLLLQDRQRVGRLEVVGIDLQDFLVGSRSRRSTSSICFS